MKDLADANKKMQEAQKENNNKETRARLKRITKKKFTTTMIYALDAFEKSFGSLWGIDKEDLTDLEQANRVLWNVIRKNILDNGNHQMRSLLSELDLYDMKFIGYRMDLLTKEEK